MLLLSFTVMDFSISRFILTNRNVLMTYNKINVLTNTLMAQCKPVVSPLLAIGIICTFSYVLLKRFLKLFANVMYTSWWNPHHILSTMTQNECPLPLHCSSVLLEFQLCHTKYTWWSQTWYMEPWGVLMKHKLKSYFTSKLQFLLNVSTVLFCINYDNMIITIAMVTVWLQWDNFEYSGKWLGTNISTKWRCTLRIRLISSQV